MNHTMTLTNIIIIQVIKPWSRQLTASSGEVILLNLEDNGTWTSAPARWEPRTLPRVDGTVTLEAYRKVEDQFHNYDIVN